MEKEGSSDPRVNAIIREVSLDMAEGKYKVGVLEHLPGRANVLAYALSRLSQPGHLKGLPGERRKVRRDFPASRVASWWLLESDPGSPSASGVA